MKSIPRPDRPVRQSLRKVRWSLIYEKYKEFTMMPRRDYIANLELVWEYRKIQGCVVECGVWRGGMSAGLADVLGGNRDHYLVDSFEGLPPVKEIDGEAASKWQKDTKSPLFFDNCAAGSEWATNAMTKAKPKSFKLVRG
jgi:O-methyltransferase